MNSAKRDLCLKLCFHTAMVLAGSALVASCCRSSGNSGTCVVVSIFEAIDEVADDNTVLAPAGNNLPKAVTPSICPSVNFLQGAIMPLANNSYVGGLQRQPNGSFTGWEYNDYAPFSLVGSAPVTFNCKAPGTPTFQNPPGWTAMRDLLGNTSQPVVFANLLGNGTPVGLAIVPPGTGLLGEPATASLIVAVPNPNGTPKPVNYYSVPAGAQTILTGDFNNDGKDDVAVIASFNSTGIAVYLGNGDGTLQLPKMFSGNQDSIEAAAYDFNGDGKLDLAVLDGLSNNVSILIGNGDGTFAAAVNYAAGVTGAGQIVAGDFNGDGHEDLAVSGASSISVLLNKSNGTFGAAVNTPATFNYITGLAAGDFNNDGKLDVALTDSAGGTVSIFLGDGSGKFPTEYDYLAGSLVTRLFAMDLDGDGNLDVVIASGHPDLLVPNENSQVVTALFGRGDGTLIGPPAYHAGSSPNAIAIADFNGDGKLDMAAAAGQLWIGLAGQTPMTINLAPGVSASGLAVADVNGDGYPDIVVGDSNGSGIYVLLGNGDGTFKPPVAHPTGGGVVNALAIADFNGDGNPDIVFCGYQNALPPVGAAGILFGNGKGTFQPVTNLTGFGTAPASLAVGDFNHDGKPDLAIADQGYRTLTGGLIVYLNQGNGILQPAANYATGQYPVYVAAADVNGDQLPDLMVTTEDPNYASNGQWDVAVLLDNGNGTFKAPAYFATQASPNAIAVADLNGDGKPDLAIGHCCSASSIGYLLGNGDGTFQTESEIPTPIVATTLAAADLDGEGTADLIAGMGLRVGYVAVLRNLTTTTPPAAAVSASPPSGGGLNGTFTFTFSDSGGYQNLSVADVLIASALDGRHACYIAYVPASSSVLLVDDAGDAGGPYQGLVLPSGGSISNSQCSINGTGSSASGSGNILTLTLNVTFSASFSGNKVFYLSAQDQAGANSGWQALGTWGVPGGAVTGPSVTGMTPAHSTTLGPNTYTFTFTDTNGWQDIAVANILINSAIDGRQACYIAYVPGTASVLLVDDAGDAGGPYQGIALPSSASVGNSQCSINGAASSVSTTGNSLSLTLAITFSPSFAGNQLFFLAARNNTLNSNWQPVGTASLP